MSKVFSRRILRMTRRQACPMYTQSPKVRKDCQLKCSTLQVSSKKKEMEMKTAKVMRMMTMTMIMALKTMSKTRKVCVPMTF